MKRFLLIGSLMLLQSNSLSIEIDTHKLIKVVYTNWRGETAERTILPIEIYWGSTEWHSDEQWLLKVRDIERNAERIYALKDIKKWALD